jgi:hypothetical protein
MDSIDGVVRWRGGATQSNTCSNTTGCHQSRDATTCSGWNHPPAKQYKVGIVLHCSARTAHQPRYTTLLNASLEAWQIRVNQVLHCHLRHRMLTSERYLPSYTGLARTNCGFDIAELNDAHVFDGVGTLALKSWRDQLTPVNECKQHQTPDSTTIPQPVGSKRCKKERKITKTSFIDL